MVRTLQEPQAQPSQLEQPQVVQSLARAMLATVESLRGELPCKW